MLRSGSLQSPFHTNDAAATVTPVIKIFHLLILIMDYIRSIKMISLATKKLERFDQ